MKRLIFILPILFSACIFESQPPSQRSEAEPAREAREPEGESGEKETAAACLADWTEVAPGLRRRDLGCNASSGEWTLHLVEVEPARWTIDGYRSTPKQAEEAAKDTGAAFVINSNFFDEKNEALGAVVQSGKLLQPPHPVSWESIFYMTKDGRAGIVLPKSWPRVRDRAVAAGQAGPRLVSSGSLLKLSPGSPSQRSGVCLPDDRRVIFFVSGPQVLLDVQQIGQLAAKDEKSGGMGCREAMLFDGGPSAQMYLRGSIEMNGDEVPAFIVAKEKNEE